MTHSENSHQVDATGPCDCGLGGCKWNDAAPEGGELEDLLARALEQELAEALGNDT